MNPLTLFSLFATPAKGWGRLVRSKPTISSIFFLHVIPFSLIPPLMLFLAGGKYGGQFFPSMNSSKLLLIGMVFFLVELAVVPVMATLIRQLGELGEIHPSFKDSFIIAAVAPTPLWMAPIFLLVPNALVNVVVIAMALMATAGLLYYGIPVVFRMKEQGHATLVFGAVLIAGTVALGFLMVCTLVVWGSIQNLQYSMPLLA
jgi:hypothetical protein